MRVGFAGTPEFAARALTALVDRRHTIPIVLTQPDRPSGRGMRVTPSAVKRVAIAHALPVAQPHSLRAAQVVAELRAIDLDVLVVAAYGLILPQDVLQWPRSGCVNIHASLLPRWRGAAPIARAIEAGDAQTGITVMQMDAGLDTGPVIVREPMPIALRDTAGTLHDRLAALGARLIVETIDRLEREGSVASVPQPSDGVTYAAKIDGAERRIDWAQSADAIDRKVRALTPAPGAVAHWQGTPVKVVAAIPLHAEVAPAAAAAPAGTIVAVGGEGIDVVCAGGSRLRLTQLQPAGGRPMGAAAFAAGRAIAAGGRFDDLPAPTDAR
jgi:methionyl-tRNA formyltransferase